MAGEKRGGPVKGKVSRVEEHEMMEWNSTWICA